MMRYGYGMMAWGSLFWLILIAVMIVIGIYVYRLTTSGKGNENTTINDNAVEILNKRYARGEIDEDQYKRMRDSIEREIK